MRAKDFVKKYYQFAKDSEIETGLSAIAILSQCALETGWGEHCPGNMMFGVKATKSTPEDKKQLLRTVEYSKRNDLKFPVIIFISQLPNGKWKYIVKDWFRKYDSPKESFVDHANLFQRVKAYSAAWKVRGDYNLFFDKIQGIYATDPNYKNKLKSIAKTIKLYINEN